jgi:phosphoenolpyruvate-protein kinase (PTS system EI component)
VGVSGRLRQQLKTLTGAAAVGCSHLLPSVTDLREILKVKTIRQINMAHLIVSGNYFTRA